MCPRKFAQVMLTSVNVEHMLVTHSPRPMATVRGGQSIIAQMRLAPSTLPNVCALRKSCDALDRCGDPPSILSSVPTSFHVRSAITPGAPPHRPMVGGMCLASREAPPDASTASCCPALVIPTYPSPAPYASRSVIHARGLFYPYLLGRARGGAV
ncbi:hypothetical protein C8Q77DRAFT_168034 [Trametes polyzona]|nr:hypothetical protein C8Q77DRAFT_168034 [Trametes polyzona]